VIYITLYHLG